MGGKPVWADLLLTTYIRDLQRPSLIICSTAGASIPCISDKWSTRKQVCNVRLFKWNNKQSAKCLRICEFVFLLAAKAIAFFIYYYFEVIYEVERPTHIKSLGIFDEFSMPKKAIVRSGLINITNKNVLNNLCCNQESTWIWTQDPSISFSFTNWWILLSKSCLSIRKFVGLPVKFKAL